MKKLNVTTAYTWPAIAVITVWFWFGITLLIIK